MSRGIQSQLLSAGTSAASSVIRIPLTISAVGIIGYGVVSTLVQLYNWLGSIAAGARLSSTVVAAEWAGRDSKDIETISRRTTTATLWHARWYLLVILTAFAVLPLQRFLDPGHHYGIWSLRLVCEGSLVVAVLATYGAARLGVLTCWGSFAEQNVSIMFNAVTTTAATLFAWWLDAPVVVFAFIWLSAFAAPALSSTVRRLPLALRALSQPIRTWSRDDVSRSGLWVSITQQVASGFDLVIVTAVIGTRGAAVYALVSRLLQLAVAPALGAIPTLTLRAGQARTLATATARRACRRGTLVFLGAQLVAIGVVGALLPLGVRIVSTGKITAPALLIVAGVVWAVLAVARSVLLCLTSTEGALRRWRRLNIWFGVINFAASIGATYLVGVSGPLWGTILSNFVTTTWMAVSCRETLASCLAK